MQASAKVQTVQKQRGEQAACAWEEQVAAGLRPGGRSESSASADPQGFSPCEPHSVCTRRGWTQHASSAALGWRNLFVSSQTEAPEEVDYGSVRHHLLVVHCNGPASVSLRMAGRTTVKQVAAGGSTLAPGGEGFTVRIFDTVDGAHIYLRQEMIDRVMDERGIAIKAPQLQPFFGVQEPLLEHLALACVALRSASLPNLRRSTSTTLHGRWRHI